MSYEYDAGATRLLIEEDKTMDGVTPLALLQMEHLHNPTLHIHIKPEDAPTVALAILEATGVKPAWDEGAQPNPERWASKAVEALLYSVKSRAEIAAREAEDARVRAWWDNTRYGHTTSLSWAHMGESAHEDVRKQYRLARDFFEVEA